MRKEAIEELSLSIIVVCHTVWNLLLNWMNGAILNKQKFEDRAFKYGLIYLCSHFMGFNRYARQTFTSPHFCRIAVCSSNPGRGPKKLWGHFAVEIILLQWLLTRRKEKWIKYIAGFSHKCQSVTFSNTIRSCKEQRLCLKTLLGFQNKYCGMRGGITHASCSSPYLTYEIFERKTNFADNMKINNRKAGLHLLS